MEQIRRATDVAFSPYDSRPLQQRQQDYHKAKARIFSVDVPERGSASQIGGQSSTSGSPGIIIMFAGAFVHAKL
jgi:hypothetical protein